MAGLLSAIPPDAIARTLYVSATADTGGDGSRRAPFESLAAVEATARRGDRIVVLRSPASAEPLDGGIKLKPNQSLVGAGPSVFAKTPSRRAPRITNTDAERLSGDAVRLARGATVRNLVIAAAVRGGIYGKNVRGVIGPRQ